MTDWIKIPDEERGWEPIKRDRPSELESLARGTGQGALFGWGDEAEAGIRSLVGDESYEEELSKARLANKLAKETNPISYGVGEYAVPLAIPGTGMLKGLSTAGKVAVGAGVGGIAGLGTTEGDKLSEQGAINTAVGAGIGGAATYGIQKLADKFLPKAKLPVAATTQDMVESIPSKNLPSVKESQGLIDDLTKVYEQTDPGTEITNAWTRATGLPAEKMPKYLGTQNRQLERLADDVLQSSTLAGKSERAAVEPAYKAIENFASNVEKQAGNVSKYEAGRGIKEGFKKAFDQEMSVPKAIYQEIESQFKDVPIRKLALGRSLNRLDNDLGKLDPSGKSSALIGRLRDFSENIDSVDKLRKVRENLFKSFRPDELTDNESQIVNEFYNVLTRERNRSIMNNVLTAGPKEAQKLSVESAQDLLTKLKTADSLWAKGIERFSGVLPIKERRGSSTVNAINKYLTNEGTPLEQYVSDMLDKGDLGGMMKLQAQFPEIFEVVKKRALSEGIEKATSRATGTATPRSIVNQLGGLKDSKTRDLLFGEDLNKQLSDIQTLQGALPKNFNPSGTANRMIQEGALLNPAKWPSEVGRQLQYGYKGKILRGETPVTSEVISAAKKFSPQEIIIRLRRDPEGAGYAQILQNAAQRGNNSYSATYFLLHQKEPRFREIVQRDEEQKNQYR